MVYRNPGSKPSKAFFCWEHMLVWGEGEPGKALGLRSTLENKTSSKDFSSLLTSLQTLEPAHSSCVPQATNPSHSPSSAPHDLLTAGYLHSGLGQPQPLAQFFTHKGVRVVSLIKKPFQLVELFQGEIGPTSPLLDFGLAFVLHPLCILFAILQLRGHWRGYHEQGHTHMSPRTHSNTHTHTHTQTKNNTANTMSRFVSRRMAVSAPSRSSCPGPHPAERMRIPEMRKDQLGWLPAGKVGIHLPNPFHNCGPSSPSHCSPPQSPALPRKQKPIPLTLSLAFTLSHTRTEIKSAAPCGSQNAIPAEEGGEARDWALTPAIPVVRTPSQPALAAAGSPVFSQTCWSNLGTIGLLGHSWRTRPLCCTALGATSLGAMYRPRARAKYRGRPLDSQAVLVPAAESQSPEQRRPRHVGGLEGSLPTPEQKERGRKPASGGRRNRPLPLFTPSPSPLERRTRP